MRTLTVVCLLLIAGLAGAATGFTMMVADRSHWTTRVVGWLCLMASGAMLPATAAALPPEEPPGIRSVFHGLRVIWNALFSVDEPIANSSMFVLPIRTASAALSAVMTWAS